MYHSVVRSSVTAITRRPIPARHILLASILVLGTLVPGISSGENLRFQLGPQSPATTASSGPAPLDAIENGRITIRSVSINGRPVTYPELGITREGIRHILEKHTGMDEGRMTVSDMHRMADELTRYYRDNGLSFAEFIVSPQEIVAGHLQIDLLVGVLAEIRIRGNDHYNTRQVLSYFESQMMAPVYTPDIETALERLNRLPGLEVFGIFSMGQQQGEAVLNLRAKEEPAGTTRLRMDNHGIENTGEYRAIIQHQANNLLASGSSLTVTAMTTEESNNLYGGLGYRQPVGLSHLFSASVSYNQFAVSGEFSALGLEGDLQDATLGWEFLPEHQPGFDSTLGVNLSARQATVSSDLFSNVLGSEYRYFQAAPFLDFVHSVQPWRLKHSFRISPVYGLINSTENAPDLDDYLLLQTRYSLRHQWLTDSPEFQISLTLEGQFTREALPPSERQPLSGPNGVRGFETGLYSADTWYRVSLMQTLYRFQSSGNWQIVPYTFVDYSDGRKETKTTSEARFLGTGAGLEIAYGQTLKAGVNWGYALDSEITPDPGRLESDTSVYGYISTKF